MNVQPLNLAISSAQHSGTIIESERHGTKLADEMKEFDKEDVMNNFGTCERQKIPIGFSIADHLSLTNEQLGGLKDSEEIIRSHIALLNDVEANLRGERIRLTGVLQQQHEMHLQLGGAEDAVESTSMIQHNHGADIISFNATQLKRCGGDKSFKTHGGTEGDDSGECSEFDECDDSVDGRLYFGGQSILQNFQRFATASAAAKNNNNCNDSGNKFLHQFATTHVGQLPQDAPVDLSINSKEKHSANMIPSLSSFGSYFPLMLSENNFQQQSRRPMLPTVEDPLEQFMSVNDNQNIKWREMYERHSRTNPPNRCGECQKDLSCKSALIMHYRTHTEERPYICKICQKSFTTKGNLKTHLGVHRELLPLLRNLNRSDHMPPFVIGNQCNLSSPKTSPKPSMMTNQCSTEEKQLAPPVVSRHSFMESLPVQTTENSAVSKLSQNDASFSSFNTFRRFPTAFPLSLMEQNPLTHMFNQLQQQQQVLPFQNDKPAHLTSLQLPMLPLHSFPSQHLSLENDSASASLPVAIENVPTLGHNIGEDLRLTCRSADFNSSYKAVTDNNSYCKNGDDDCVSPAMDESNSSLAFDETQQQLHQTTSSLTTTPILEGNTSDREARTTCRVCGKVCSCRSALQIHMRTHTKEKPFLCVVCGKAFSTKGNMRQHESTHKRGSMLYSTAAAAAENGGNCCLDADPILFSSASTRGAGGEERERNKDAVGLSSERNLFENNCEQSSFCRTAQPTTQPSEQATALFNEILCTVSPSLENADIRNESASASAADFASSNYCATDTSTDSCNGFHKQRRICEVCHKECPTKSSLDIHMRSHTGEKPYSCPRCTKRFSTMGNMQAHLKRHCPETRAADERAAAAVCPQSQLYSFSRAIEENLLNSSVSSVINATAMSAVGCLPSGFHAANVLNGLSRGGIFPGFLPAPRDLLAPPNCWPALFSSQIGMPFAHSFGLPPPNLSAQEHLRQSFLNEEEFLDEDESMDDEDGEEVMSDENLEVNGNCSKLMKCLPSVSYVDTSNTASSCFTDSAAAMNTLVS